MAPADVENLHKLIVNYLPKNFGEQDVLNLFSVFGKVHSCKLMLDLKTGESKGWCFVNYFNLEDAQKAITSYNGLKMQNKVIRVSFAGDDAANKGQVFVSGLKKDMSQKELESIFSDYGDVNWCYIMPKGAALIRFDSKEHAAVAIAELNDKTIPNNPYPLKVSLHESSRGQAKASDHEEESDFMGKVPSSTKAKTSLRFTPTGFIPKLSSAEVSTLYVSGLPEYFDEAKLYKMFSPCGAIAKATILTNPETNLCKGVAFVDMVNREDALSAIQALHGTTMNDRVLRVAFKSKKSNNISKNLNNTVDITPDHNVSTFAY